MRKKRGGKYGCGTEGENELRWKGEQVGGTHSDPMHSNIFAMKPM